MTHVMSPAMNLLKPIGGVRVNWKHPMNRGLTAWFAMTQWGSTTIFDLVNNKQGALLVNAVWSGTYRGSSISLASGRYVEISEPIITGYPISICATGYGNDLTSDNCLFAIGDSDGNSEISVRLAGNDSGDYIKLTRRNSGGTQSSLASDTAYVVGQIYSVVGIAIADNNVALYIDGINKKTATTSNVLDWANFDHACIGKRAYTGTDPGNSGILDLQLWNRVLSDSEVASLIPSRMYGSASQPRLLDAYN